MKKIQILICLVVINFNISAQSIGINTTAPHASAILDIKSNTRGMLIPRTSTSSRLAILNPAKGLMVYDTTTSSFGFYNGADLNEITAGANDWSLTGNGDSQLA